MTLFLYQYVSTHLPSTKPETAHASQSASTDQKSAPTRPTLPATINNGQRHVITTDSDMTNTNFFTINGTSTAKQEQTFKKRLHIDPSKEAATKPKIVKSEGRCIYRRSSFSYCVVSHNLQLLASL